MFNLFMVMLAVFFILIAIEVLLMYMHYSAGFSPSELALLLLFPLFAYISTLPYWMEFNEYNNIWGLVSETPRLFDLPIFQVENSIIGFNLIGVLIPVIISFKILVEKRVPARESGVLVLIISCVTYFYTYFRPEVGIIVYFFAIPAILAAAISFMFKMVNPDVNPPLLSYVGATLGVLMGADIFNLNKLISYPYSRTVFISIGGGGVLDAIFLAGLVAIIADLLIRGQEESILKNFMEIIKN